MGENAGRFQKGLSGNPGGRPREIGEIPTKVGTCHPYMTFIEVGENRQRWNVKSRSARRSARGDSLGDTPSR